jgi:hypothetical protein
MTSYRKSLICFLIILAALITLADLAQATTMNFTVHAGEEETRSINLAVEDRVLIRFTVIGQTASMLRFSLVFPNATVKDFGEVGELSYSFICDAEGEHTLHFINSDSTEDKLVTLNYEVEHYILGMPQMLFLTIVIVLLCVGLVATYILMGKTS